MPTLYNTKDITSKLKNMVRSITFESLHHQISLLFEMYVMLLFTDYSSQLDYKVSGDAVYLDMTSIIHVSEELGFNHDFLSRMERFRNLIAHYGFYEAESLYKIILSENTSELRKMADFCGVKISLQD